MSPKPALHIENTDIGYSHPIVKGISATLNMGEVCLLMGNNGQGKTTLIKSILRQLPLHQGSILLEGIALSELSPKQIAKKIAIVFAKASLSPYFTTYDLISLGKFVHYPYYFSLSKEDHKQVKSIIQQLDLTPFENTPLTHLSDGNLQKAFLGRALAQDTPILILDEPTTHLDMDNRKMILKLLRKIAKEQNKAILFSSHDIYGATEVADNIWHIHDEKLSSGLAEDMLMRYIQNNQQPTNKTQFDSLITAPPLEKQLLKSALEKHLSSLPPCHIYFDNQSWQLSINQHHHQFSTIGQVIAFLQKLS